MTIMSYVLSSFSLSMLKVTKGLISLIHDCIEYNRHFICYFFKRQLAVKFDLVDVVYYLKQVFHLLHDKSATPAEALLCFSLIS